MDRKDLQNLSAIRLKEAKALSAQGLYDGAYYLAGYAVECALKACIAKRTRRHEFPDRRKVEASHTHNLRELVKIAGLEDARNARSRIDGSFQTNWDLVQSWSEQDRYRRHLEAPTRALLEAIGERNHGVISWIRLHW